MLDFATIGMAFEASPTATIVTDDRLRIIAANAAYERLTRQRRPEWLGSLPCVLRLHDDAMHQMARASRGGLAMPCEVIVSRRDGSQCRVWMSWARLSGHPDVRCRYVATFSDLGRWDGDFELWRHRARHDTLTGLPNRDHLDAELERGLARAARHGHRLATLFIDLDGFKSINDRCGHAAGDSLLARVGLLLRATLRSEDFVARYGGDEFVVVIEAPRHAADAAAAAVALLGALGREPALQDCAGPPIAASIGIAIYPDHACDATGLLQAADRAMYRAKRDGGNAFAFGLAPSVALQRPREAV